MLGIDYFATQQESTMKCFKDNGLVAIARYYDHSVGTSVKSLDKAEADTALRLGLAIFPVFEWDATDALDGYHGGVQDATSALAAAKAAGQPKGTPIYFAVDFDAQEHDLWGPVVEYFNGVHDTINGEYQIGIYGSYRTVRTAQLYWPAVTHYWQTLAWSYGKVAPDIDLYQYQTGSSGAQPICGVDVDYNTVYIQSPWRADMGSDLEDTIKAIKARLEIDAHHRHMTPTGWTSEPLEPPVTGAEYFGADASLTVIGWKYPDGQVHWFKNGEEINA